MPVERLSRRPDRTPITERIDAMYQSFREGDTGGIEECLAAGATVWDVFVPQLIRGRSELERFHTADREQAGTRGQLTLRMSEPLIDVRDGVAWARYLLKFRYLPPNAISGTIRVTDVLVLEGGSWLIAHHHEGLAPEGRPYQPE